jgi:hypothetical protein
MYYTKPLVLEYNNIKSQNCKEINDTLFYQLKKK